MSNTRKSPTPRDQHRNARNSSRKPRRSRAQPADQPGAGLLTITVDAGTAQVVGLEGVGATGKRHDLSRAERESLLERANGSRLEDLLEFAFEAGIACVLDSDAGSEARQESAADAELRHRLLEPLMERSAVRHLTEGPVLDRAILYTLIDHSTRPPSAA